MKLRRLVRQVTVSLAAIIITVFYPLAGISVSAEEPVPPESSVTTSSPVPSPPPCPVPEGTRRPTGSAAHTYAFNEETCLWENDYYTWDPVTKTYEKKTPYDYDYKPGSNSWEKVEPPAPKPDPVTPPTNLATGTNAPKTTSNATNSLTDPNDTQASVNGTNSTGIDLDTSTTADVYNMLFSQALSGNAAVSRNTSAGSALSGDAAAVANVINMLQSNAGFGAGEVATFSADVYGDVFGDLFLDPSVLAALQPANGYSNDLELDINTDLNGSINNDITLDARSGDATVRENTNAGDATSGNATAILNLVNMINSAIGSGDSFMGMLNIYGNLNGDILLPPDVLNQIVATNTPPSSTLDTSVIENTEILADFTSNQTIVNDIDMESASGNAVVNGNNHAGSATTGDATSNLTVLNLTGRDVIAANSLLVFVNVLGEWVGLIMNAPAGTTSAALGTGVTQNNVVNNLSADIDSTIDSSINNDINMTAVSGDARVLDNTNAGDATSGDASTSANVVNIMNSNFALSDWFGILFINVFGSWLGSFGVDTMAGNHPVFDSPATGGSGSGEMKVFQFVPTSASSVSGGSNSPYRLVPIDAEESETPNEVLATTSEHMITPDTIDVPVASAMPKAGRNWTIPILSVVLGAALLGTERVVNLRERRRRI